MADGSVTIKVDLDGSDAQSGVGKLKTLLGGVENAGSKVGSVFKSVLGANIVSSALISGVQQLGGAIKDVFSTAIDEGAKLEQSIGGVETLFKGSADKVKAYADQAFRTAGLSANEYMENVTSFSASLLQSLGGDTEKAADVANRAMIDMSDNANKMGTNMELIQNAYQGFAKDNFTMLDNLKLGYGGTKTEMQRLIKDAAAMKDVQEELNVAVEDGDMSFGNMVNAISVMQKHLGIAGTTAKEASTTLSGSLASMKASWTDLLGKIALGKDIGPALKNLVSTTSTFLLGNFLPMVGNIMKQLPKAISGALAEAGPQLEKGFKSLFSNLGIDTSIFDVVKDTFRDITVTFETLFSALTSKSNGFNNVIEGIGNIIKVVNFAIQDLARAFQFALEAFAETGAIRNVYSAFKELTEAALDLSEKLADAIPWDVVGAAAGHIVNAISMIVSWIAKLSKSISGDVWRGLVTGIGGALVAFKAFNFLKSFNPFKFFKKNATSETSGVTSVVQSASNGIVSTIKTLGQSISIAAKGIGQGIGIAFRGIGQGLSMVNPATIAALAVPILALGAAFALMGTHGQGISAILQGLGSVIISVGTAIGQILNMALQGLAQALVIVAPVLPIIASSFAVLTPVITAFGTALSQVITALSAGIAQIATAVTPIIEILGGVFTTVVEIVSNAIVQIVQALAPFMPAVSEMVQAVAPVVQSIIEAFTNLVNQISPIISNITNLFKTLGEQITNILDSAKGVIESFGGAVRNILDGIAGIFDSIGNAALNAGKGFKLLAEGVVMITKTNLADMAASLAAVAVGVGAISAASGGMASAGNGMKSLGQGLMLVSTFGTSAMTALTTLQSTMTSLPAMLATTAASFATFTAQAVAGLAGLSAINDPITTFKTQIMTIVPALTLAIASFAKLGTLSTIVSTHLQIIASGVQAMVTAFNNSVGQIENSLQSILSAIVNEGNRMKSQGRQIGTETVQNLSQGLLNGQGQVVASMTSLVSSARAVGMRGVATMRTVGAYIGQGLAQGMLSELGAVTAAADALVSQAERAAQAKAKIHSPSRLFRDNVGRYIAQGIAVGIEQNASDVTDSLAYVQKEMSAFKFGAEELLGLGNSSLSSQFKLKSIMERAETSRIEIVREQANQELTKALEIAEKAVKRPVNMVLDDGALVAKIGKPMTDYQNDKLLLDNMMRGIT